MKKKKEGKKKLEYAGYHLEIEKNKVTIFEKKGKKIKDEEAMKIVDYLAQEGFFNPNKSKDVEIVIVSS